MHHNNDDFILVATYEIILQKFVMVSWYMYSILKYFIVLKYPVLFYLMFI
jgi:hypothetical protein